MKIKAIATYLPEKVLSTEELAAEFPNWSVDKVIAKTGIRFRHIAAANEYASDMAVAAAEKLFSSGFDRSAIDYLIVCSQSPDYLLPSTACLVHKELNLSTQVGAIDVNLGCSGYVYALSLAYGLILSNQAERVLVITTDTYSKFLAPQDKAVRALFGDAATATYLERDQSKPFNFNFLFGSDGNGASKLIVENSALRMTTKNPVHILHMDGPAIMDFALNAIPQMYNQLIAKSSLNSDQIKYIIFHQANAFLLECLRTKLSIPREKFIIDLETTGNTVSATIPIALSNLISADKLSAGDPLLLIGFGVGYSWAGCLLEF